MPTKQAKRRPTALDEFIQKVNARLAETGMSMSELARRAGVNRPYIYRILSGDHVPSLTIAESIAKVLGLKIATLSV